MVMVIDIDVMVCILLVSTRYIMVLSGFTHGIYMVELYECTAALVSTLYNCIII